MKSLTTLIELQKTTVDEQRQHLTRLYDNLDAIETKITAWDRMMTQEQAAAQDQAARTTYAAFLNTMIAKGRALAQERQTAIDAVHIAQEKLAELFEEQKRYEIAEEQRIAAQAVQERRRETLDMDEIGGVMHERKRNE